MLFYFREVSADNRLSPAKFAADNRLSAAQHAADNQLHIMCLTPCIFRYGDFLRMNERLFCGIFRFFFFFLTWFFPINRNFWGPSRHRVIPVNVYTDARTNEVGVYLQYCS